MPTVGTPRPTAFTGGLQVGFESKSTAVKRTLRGKPGRCPWLPNAVASDLLPKDCASRYVRPTSTEIGGVSVSIRKPVRFPLSLPRHAACEAI